MIIKEVMNKAIATEKDISIREAAKIMSDKNIGSLIFINGSSIKGIITERDILKHVVDVNRKISSIMTMDVTTINQNEELDTAAEIMARNNIRRLPVVDDNQRLVGIITSTDVIAHTDELEEDFFLD
jgi:CBS domain-containing protein